MSYEPTDQVYELHSIHSKQVTGEVATLLSPQYIHSACLKTVWQPDIQQTSYLGLDSHISLKNGMSSLELGHQKQTEEHQNLGKQSFIVMELQ